eukprot:comp20892_c0_seq1/m.43464 comp20892_c0_seq1/g.43464  ORF comp20892_c0_seq1/g.43464 comp20892_c0_seq1/m.43464 type:complete len:379 (-) comp20892_c0_seq1:306-1442(-)
MSRDSARSFLPSSRFASLNLSWAFFFSICARCSASLSLLIAWRIALLSAFSLFALISSLASFSRSFSTRAFAVSACALFCSAISLFLRSLPLSIVSSILAFSACLRSSSIFFWSSRRLRWSTWRLSRACALRPSACISFWLARSAMSFSRPISPAARASSAPLALIAALSSFCARLSASMRPSSSLSLPLSLLASLRSAASRLRSAASWPRRSLISFWIPSAFALCASASLLCRFSSSARRSSRPWSLAARSKRSAARSCWFPALCAATSAAARFASASRVFPSAALRFCCASSCWSRAFSAFVLPCLRRSAASLPFWSLSPRCRSPRVLSAMPRLAAASPALLSRCCSPRSSRARLLSFPAIARLPSAPWLATLALF